MKRIQYSVKIDGEILYHDLSKKEAAEIAKREAATGKQVFVQWFRRQDGQHGALNRDGSHEITGAAW